MNNRGSAIFSASLFATYDFDADAQVLSSLNGLDLEKNKHFAPVGFCATFSSCG